MTTRYGSFLRADLLKAGHHGSITSSTVKFIDQVRPAVVLISVGRRNKFHHPSPVVLDRYRARECAVFRTDETGAVIFESDGREWKRVDWR
jgi:competence protein ComEC